MTPTMGSMLRKTCFLVGYSLSMIIATTMDTTGTTEISIPAKEALV